MILKRNLVTPPLKLSSIFLIFLFAIPPLFSQQLNVEWNTEVKIPHGLGWENPSDWLFDVIATSSNEYLAVGFSQNTENIEGGQVQTTGQFG